MIHVDNPDDKKLVEKVYESRQEHIFKFWDELNKEQKASLLQQVKDIDFELLEKLISKHVIEKTKTEEQIIIRPAAILELPKTEEELSKQKKAKEMGEQMLRDGKIAVFLVAGGQGTRLGYDGPKGCFHISPVKNKPIFQLHAEQIVALQKRYNTVLPWYIMTSEENDKQTKVFFEQHNFFGLPKSNVMFFKQAMIPAVSSKGKLILCQKDRIFKNPDGHGGSILALEKSGAIADMKSRGIEHIFYFQVDNILAKIADPVFIGYHILNNAEMSTKVVEKTDPKEKVGVIGYVNGKLSIIEYSYLSVSDANARDLNGKLKYRAGNIAIHMIHLDFIQKMNLDEFSLPYYKAFKAVGYIDDEGKIINPDEPNAIKFEKFIFDALKKTTSSVTMEVKREEEFAPVKNNEGVDSPQTARQLIMDLHNSWLKIAGITVPDSCKIEISPLFALDFEELNEKIDKGLVLEHNSEVYFG